MIDREFSLLNAMEDYIKLLHSKDIAYLHEVKPVTGPADLSTILSSLLASQNSLAVSQDKNAQAQDKMINTLDKNLAAVVRSNASNSKSGPKPAQPKFKPKGNNSDYGAFKDFLSKFDFFTAKYSTNVEKLQ